MRTISDKGPEYSKFELAGLPPLQARIQSCSWPSGPSGIRSSVLRGRFLYFFIADSGTSRGDSP